jgi:hypothetical protein
VSNFNAVSGRIAGAPRPTERASRPTCNPRAAPHVPRTTTNPRMSEALSRRQNLHTLTHRSTGSDGDHERPHGEALFGREDVGTHAPPATFRERSRPHAWAKPCLIARTYNACTPSARSENDPERTHGRSPVWRAGPTTPVALLRSESDCEPTYGRSPVWRADPRRSYERSISSRTPRVAARLGWSFLITP